MNKVLIVEGKTDKEKLKNILAEPVEIITTFGTLGQTKLDELALLLEDEDVYIFVDSDDSGEKLRSQLKRYLPNAKHLYIQRMYREVADTPTEFLVRILKEAHFLTVDY